MSSHENVKLREVLQAMYEHSNVAESDARRNARALGAAKNSTQVLGAHANYEADGNEIFSRHVQGAIDIAYTIASIVVGQGSGGGGAKAPVAPQSAAMNLILQNTGIAGAMIDGAIRGAAEGGFAGAVKGALQGAGEWLMANSGLAGQLLSSSGDSLQDHLRYGRIGKARDVLIDGVRVGDMWSDAQLLRMSKSVRLEALPNQVAGAAIQHGSEVIGSLIADRGEEAEKIEQLAQQLAQAEGEAKKRRAKAQVARVELERLIIEVDDLAIPA